MRILKRAINCAWWCAPQVARQNDRIVAPYRPYFSFVVRFVSQNPVVETLLDPDERGLVDRWKIFRFIKCVLPGVPDRAVNGVADDLMDTIQTGSKKRGAHIRKGSSARTSSDIGSSDVLIGEFMERGDFVDRLTLHI